MTTNPKKTFTLFVEPRHFEGAIRKDPENCGVFNALLEYGIADYAVGRTSYGYCLSHWEKGRFNFSEQVSKLIEAWDDFGIIPPPFTLELPVSLLEDALIPVTA